MTKRGPQNDEIAKGTTKGNPNGSSDLDNLNSQRTAYNRGVLRHALAHPRADPTLSLRNKVTNDNHRSIYINRQTSPAIEASQLGLGYVGQLGLYWVGLGRARHSEVWAKSGRPPGKSGLAQKSPKLSPKKCHLCLSNHKISLSSFLCAVNPRTCVIRKLLTVQKLPCVTAAVTCSQAPQRGHSSRASDSSTETCVSTPPCASIQLCGLV